MHAFSNDLKSEYSDFKPGDPVGRCCAMTVMDESDPEITFDEKGISNHWYHAKARLENEWFPDETGKKKLYEIADTIKKEGKGKKYDCILGISGGTDSTMVAYLAKDLGLRPLAVHLDNGWNTELAQENIQNILKVLDIDLLTHVIDWPEFRDLQLSFFKASVPNIEIPTDHAVNAIAFNIAAKYGVRFILSGSNVATEAIMPSAWTYDNRDLYHLKAIHKKFGRLPLKTFPTYGILRFAYYFGIRKMRFIRPLNLISYNKKEAHKLLKEKFGWRDYGAKHFESVFTRFYQGYLLPRKFGYDKRKAHLSALIASNQITRHEAKLELEKETYPFELMLQDKEYVCKKLGMSTSDFNEMMHQPPRKHTDYPSRAWLFRDDKFGLLKKAKNIATKSK